MSYLLVDFGASFVKTASLVNGKINSQLSFESPFVNSNSISKASLINFFDNIFINYPKEKNVITCCIMNGGWDNDIYYSWKSKNKNHDNVDLISGLFVDKQTFHQHLDHSEYGKQNISLLGTLLGKNFYSSLADTECVRRSIELNHNQFIVNLGTGSQILSKNFTHSFIPSSIVTGKEL